MSRRQIGSRLLSALCGAVFLQFSVTGVAMAQQAAPSAMPTPPATAATTPASRPSQVAQAATPPPPPPAATPPADPPAAAPPPAPPPAPAPAPEPPPPPPPMAPAPSPSSNAVAMAAPPPPKPAIAMNFGVRVGLKLQDPEQPKKMSQVHLDTTYAEARFHGDLTDYMGWTANFNVDALAGDTSDGTQASVAIMDMIARFHPSDYFNIWAGRLLVPSDRSNFSGPFFILPWNYPGFYAAGKPPLGPIDGPTGRDYGGTLWGMAIDQKLKYFVGAYGLDPAASAYHTYYSARVAYSFQGSEPGYFNQSTYYGGASVVTLGLGGQYKPKGAIDTTTGAPKDTFLFMADLLAEEATDVGTFTLEGQFYKFDDGYSFAPGYVTGATPTLLMAQNGLSKGPEEGFYVLGAYLFPEAIGPGKFQPLIRVQQTIDPSWTIVDAQLQYVIKPYNLRILLNYQHEDMNGTASNKLQFGTSLQM